ncbi:MAG: aminopeptidase P family protein [Candidatus Hydrogenedentes bacterium]|nr:aminopeptidase P family protein [Candidatus Hydrogenedentota bacterium]
MLAIPNSEYTRRIKRFQENIRAAGLDAALVHANESDFANVRYLSEYWPTFEAAGVFVPAEGSPVLIIGPESEAYARTRSKIKQIALMVEYRESAEPEYPGIPVAHFKDVIKMAMPGKKLRKLGLVGYSVMPLPVYHSLCSELPKVELVKADDTLISLRINKSANEIKLAKRAYEISEIAIGAILNEIKPGMTELQVIGIAQREIYQHGGEYEGHALYCFCGPATKHAISRPTHNTIKKNEVIQLNIGARVGGYSSSVGLPISIGKLPARKKRLVEFGLEAHFKTMELMKAGKPAADVVKEYEAFVEERGFKKYMLYGPCHGIGMMEVERPWMESTSTYTLQENMTFQVDTFFYDKDFGLRWENGVRVTKKGVERQSEKFMKIVEL